MTSNAIEWLETDGAGGFAMGTDLGVATRRYHSLLSTSSGCGAQRLVLVNAVEAWLDVGGQTLPLNCHYYAPGVIHPNPADRNIQFEHLPWPSWQISFGDRPLIRQELFMARGISAVFIRWCLLDPQITDAVLHMRPLLSGRDYHTLQLRQSQPERRQGEKHNSIWSLHENVPMVRAITSAQYESDPDWYQNFLYPVEIERGYEGTEDLWSPGVFTWQLSKTRSAEAIFTIDDQLDQSAEDLFDHYRPQELRRRTRFETDQHAAADQYLVHLGDRMTLIAGYPWFGDWGRDTFISLRGLCLATGRYREAQKILLSWADTVSQGMIPNRIPDDGNPPQYNAADASLWFIVAAYELLQSSWHVGVAARQRLLEAIDAILASYMAGTRYQIQCDDDGLLAIGEPGVQLTWMDAKIDNTPVTPRTGKPVEIQALWLNALSIAGQLLKKHQTVLERGLKAFSNRFWNSASGHLLDVVDVDHVHGRVDGRLRPNQIFAVGGLPMQLIDGEKARRVVETIEASLLTPMGLRTLASSETGYCPQYAGSSIERDKAYHQGTVWPWLLGPFVEAWLRVHGNDSAAKRQAHQFLKPLRTHISNGGVGHISEIFDAEPPHTPQGCPFQAWSLAEFLRIESNYLVPNATTKRKVITGAA